MYLHREYFKANVYTIWVHGRLGLGGILRVLVQLQFSSTSIVSAKRSALGGAKAATEAESGIDLGVSENQGYCILGSL